MGQLIAIAFPRWIPNVGARISASCPQLAPQIKADLFWGYYERAEIRFVRKYLKADLDAVELGSSIGVTASHMARRLSPGRRLVCVEPNESYLKSIEKNVRRNAPNVSLLIMHGAISYEEPFSDTVWFEPAERNVEGRLSNKEDNSARGVEGPRLDLKGVLSAGSVDEFTLVCDIEGAETQLLGRGLDDLDRCKQLIIELHPDSGEDIDGMLQRLVTRDFEIKDRRGDVFVLER